MDKPMAECYEALASAFAYFNKALFNQQLPTVIITFHRQRRVMGYVSIGRWVNHKKQYIDELAVNPEYFAKHPLIEICQTLCHEMVHIWQAHFGSPGRRGYHNAQWAKKMLQIGLAPSSTGKPGGQQTGEFMMDYVLLNGPFHLACQHLLKSGYSLPWVDRYPVFRLELPITAFDSDGHSHELTQSLTSKATLSLESVKAARTSASMSELSTPEMFGANESNLSSSVAQYPIDNDISELVTSKPKHRSGRIKYACKACHMQLWGKPGLNVKCGECDTRLMEVI